MMLSWRLHKARVLTFTTLTWLVGGFVFTILVAAVGPFALGLETYTVRSGSMEPAIGTGDMVVVSTITPTSAGIGDIVTFKDPEGSGDLITHRVRTVQAEGDQLAFVTRGDANNNVEHWRVPADGAIGRVVYRVPKLGYALAPLGTPAGRIGLIVIPCLLLIVLGLIRIWMPERVGVPVRLNILPVRRLIPLPPPDPESSLPARADGRASGAGRGLR